MPLAEPGPAPASYADTGEPCVVDVHRLDTRPPRNAFSTGGRTLQLLSADHCQDGRRIIRADVKGAFGGFG